MIFFWLLVIIFMASVIIDFCFFIFWNKYFYSSGICFFNKAYTLPQNNTFALSDFIIKNSKYFIFHIYDDRLIAFRTKFIYRFKGIISHGVITQNDDDIVTVKTFHNLSLVPLVLCLILFILFSRTDNYRTILLFIILPITLIQNIFFFGTRYDAFFESPFTTE